MVNAELAFMAVMDELDRRGYTSAVLSALEDNPNVNSLYAAWRRVQGHAAVSAYKPKDMISAFAEFMSPRPVARKSKKKSRLDHLGVPVRIY
jgi:hypothetical protein